MRQGLAGVNRMPDMMATHAATYTLSYQNAGDITTAFSGESCVCRGATVRHRASPIHGLGAGEGRRVMVQGKCSAQERREGLHASAGLYFHAL